MAALTAQKANSIQTVKRAKRALAGNVKAIKGGLAAVLNGYYQPATGAVAEIVKGRFVETVDNTGGAAGAKKAEVEFFRERTMILVANDGTNPVLVGDREEVCSVVDDQTVRAYSPSKSDAGIAYDVTSEGVWVEVDAPSSPDASGVPNIQSGTATLAAGTVTINNVVLTAASRILLTMKDPGAGAITGFANLDAPAASRNVGAGTFVVNAIDTAKATIATAVCTFDWAIIG